MPTREFNSFEELFKSLNDLEILDDKNNYPAAIIKVAGLSLFRRKYKLKIGILNAYFLDYIFLPAIDGMLNYYANKINSENNKIELKKIEEKIKLLTNGFDDKKDQDKKIYALQTMLRDPNIDYTFFNVLKKIKILPWYLKYKRYLLHIKPIERLAIWVFLYGFNIDGLKKNVNSLLQSISHITNFQTPTITSDSMKQAIYEDRFNRGEIKEKDISLDSSKKSTRSEST